ncbi:MAG: peptide chain release factor N(5)-glutamine methyltransferase [Paludibacteraceae bacterium]|nr:peptide chain release factor N(5)-glutamine methyltransferase [Paludibacteraceae bacterium]
MIPSVHEFIKEMGSLYDESETKALYYEILQTILQCNKTTLLVEGDRLMDSNKLNEFHQIVDRLKTGEPLQYILGVCSFCNYNFKVSSDVLIPRPETEELVDWIYTDNKEKENLSLLDIGTGSGCIAISIKKKMPTAEVAAMDVSSKALSIANENAIQNEVSIRFFNDNILQPANNYPSYDIIVSNPPYIMEKEKMDMHTNVLQHEPWLALFVDDNDPLLFYRKIAEFGQTHLSKNGFLYFEINSLLAQETKNLLYAYNYTDVTIKKDINDKNRMIKCQKR